MTILFTQYLRPDGRRKETEIEMPEEVEKIAQRWIDSGGIFESEVLTTGHASFTAAKNGEDVAIQVCVNGSEVPAAVERLVRRTEEIMNHD